MNRYLTLPILALGGASFKMQMDFESSMTKIIGLVGVAREQVEAWSDEVIAMAPTLGKSPKELADALFFITSAGIKDARALDVLEKSAKASAAGLGETKVVADLVTSAMNAYGPAVLNAGLATDILTATVREGKAEADSLAQSMGMVLPIASNMGVTFDQVGAAVASMTRTGTKAATASMQLRQILASILKPTSEAEETLMAMGTSATALRKAIREDGLIAVLMQLKKLQAAYGDEIMAKVFPNVRALSGVLDIVGANAEDNIKIFKSLEKSTGAAGYAFEQAAQTTEFKWNVALSSAKASLVSFGKIVAQGVIPLLHGFAERMQKLTAWFNGLTESQRKTLLKTLAITAAIGPLFTVVGMLLKGLSGIVGMGASVIKFFTRLGTLMLANPIMAVATAITAITAALIIHAKKMREQAALYEGFNDLSKQAKKNIVAQRTEVESLVKIAGDERLELEKRQAALKRLNRISPEYFGNLNKERINQENLATAAAAYTKEIVRQAKVKAAQNKIEEISAQLMEAELEYEGAQLKAGQVIGFGIRKLVSQKWALNKAVEAGTENWEEYTKGLEDSKEKLVEWLNKIITVEDIMDGVDLGLDLGDGLGLDGGGIKTELSEMDKALLAWSESLRINTGLAAVWGDQYDSITPKIEAYRNVIEDLIKAGVSPLNEMMLSYLNTLYQLEAEQVKSTWLKQAEIEMWQMFGEEVDRVNQITEDSVNKASMGASLISSAFSGMNNVIADALNSTENTLDAFWKFFVDFIKGMIIKLIAAAIAAAALAAILAAIGLPVGGLGKAFEGAKGFGQLFKAGFKTFGGMGMQAGGMVPPGYPNDSFRARLSSGETIIPLERLNEIGSSKVEVIVRPEITDAEGIRWFVEEINRKLDNSFG